MAKKDYRETELMSAPPTEAASDLDFDKTPAAPAANPVAETAAPPRGAAFKDAHKRHIEELLKAGKLSDSVSYPVERQSLRNTSMDPILRNWVTQKKMGMVTLCNDPKCYYPVVPFHSDATGHQMIAKPNKDGRVGVIGQCTWDPRHCDGEQLIYPPAKKDDDDIDFLK